ncbi:MAG: ParB-like protein [Prochlorococcus sp.]
MSFHLPTYKRIPCADEGFELYEVDVAQLQPTQWCVGLAEVNSRQLDFNELSPKERLNYLKNKPVPLVRNGSGSLWMIDRHHRLRALLDLEQNATTYGYVIENFPTEDESESLRLLAERGWLYLYNGRGQGPLSPQDLPKSLLQLEDDPYRSLAWKLKKEGLLRPEPLIPYHEFRWGNWLRSRALPPFSSKSLKPALPAARSLVRSNAASHLAGWIG